MNAAQGAALLTIGQVADYAGVTIRAVRHYHKRGLLDEPSRDASGYRRYTARDAILLIQIKTLTDAGVPLSRVKELRDASPEDFERAVDEIDRDLDARIAGLTESRKRIRELTGGDRLFVPGQVADYLDGLHALGVSQRYIQIERDLWILLWAVHPATAADNLANRLNALRDPDLRDMLVAFDRAYDADPDSPDLERIAQRMFDVTVSRYGSDLRALAEPDEFQQLIQSSLIGLSPAWDRVYDHIRARYQHMLDAQA